MLALFNDSLSLRGKGWGCNVDESNRRPTALQRPLILYPDLLEGELGLQYCGQPVVVLEKGVQERLGIP